GGAARHFRLAVDPDAVGVVAAVIVVHAVALAGNDLAAIAAALAAPFDRRARPAIFERLVLRLIGALPVGLVELAADRAAEQAADRRAGDGRRDAAGARADLVADHAAEHGAAERADILPRPRLRTAGKQSRRQPAHDQHLLHTALIP